MNIEFFQQKSMRTSNKDLSKEELTANMVIGIFGEGGEVADIVKKNLYQGHSLDREHLIEELGDLMHYVCNLASIFNISMSDVLDHNIDKLNKRYPNGFTYKDSIMRKDKV